MIFELSFRNRAYGGAVVPGQLNLYPLTSKKVSKAQGLVGFKKVTFLIHGFNVPEEKGRESLYKMATKLPSAINNEGATVFVLWPGDSPIGPLSYPFSEGHQANDSAVEMKKFIENHITPSTQLSFIAHSLGCRVAMETVNQVHMMTNGNKKKYPVNQICLMAAAIDDFSLAEPEKYKEATERASKVFVLSSVKDNVLKWAYPVGDLVQAFLFFWEESAGLALGYRGPKDYKIRDGSKTFSVPDKVVPETIAREIDVGHGDYLPSNNISQKQLATAKYVNSLLAGEKNIQYQIT